MVEAAPELSRTGIPTIGILGMPPFSHFTPYKNPHHRLPASLIDRLIASRAQIDPLTVP